MNVDEWNRMHDVYMREYGHPPKRQPCWKRPKVFYTALFLVIAAIIGLAVTGILMGKDGTMIGWRPNRGSNGEGGDDEPPTSDVSPVNDGNGTNVEGTGGFMNQEPSPSPTASPTVAPTNSPTKAPTRGPRTTPLAFYVMGDIPYAPWEETVLISQITNITKNRHPGSAFLVHVGDMMRAERTGCQQGYYQSVKNILSLGPLPTFALAGDNDYLDCPNLDTAWEYYLDTFSDFDQEWLYRLPSGVPPLEVGRWLLPENVPLEQNVTRWTTRSEMFSFTEEGILFLSMTLMHVPDDLPPDTLFQERLADSKAWVTQQVTQAAAADDPLRGVVMFGHARIAGYLRPFFMELKQIFYDAFIFAPVLYIHGDGHKFNWNDNFGRGIEWPQFVDIQVDQGAYADPLLVEVALSQGGTLQPLTSNNPSQFIAGNGLFRIDRQRGRYNSIEDENV
eukprot:CAMPEP_0202494024 /NCGR_PEP_ID=MMETSP1361-20130828/10418_1 /ASSEMBLY_ACC=CAM_ASM_000849 /TAXON_ID=210615 /ORGANISM="Staurosira complex sp., Strain CCMP2646" /LENGTH=447 /DNA_ID=CAMNT_0049124409 /DNA_START=122 /DNA_END=1465 /DNA_ORIENTATION=+